MIQKGSDSENLAIGMSVLYDASILVSSGGSYQNILSGIARHFRSLMEVDFAWLLLEENGEYGCVAALDDSGRAVATDNVPFHSRLLERVLQQELDERIDDMSVYAEEERESFSSGMSSALFCPLQRGEEAVGCFIIGARAKAAYTKEHSILLYLLGLHLGTVLRNIRLRNELVEMNDRLKIIFSNIEEGLILLDRQFQVAALNAPVADTYFPEADVQKGINFLEYLLEQRSRFKLGRWVQQLRKLIAGNDLRQPLSFELVEREKKHPMAIGVEFMPLHEAGRRQGILVLLRDIRERKKADELRRDLTSMLVHDLRSPLGIINWNMEMILDGVLGEVNEKQKKFLKGSIENSQELLDMVDSLLDIDRLETGAMALEYEEVDIPGMVREIVQRMEFLSHQMGISFTVDFPQDFPLIMADRSLVRRVLFNLVFNASKYSPPHATIEMSGSFDSESDEVVIGVRDYGPGIPRKYHRLIFDKYVQAQARNRGEIKSKGLGLTFCKLAVEAHGGHIWVESEPGEGSHFRFRLTRSSGHERSRENGESGSNIVQSG